MADPKPLEVGFFVKLKELNEGMAKATGVIKEQTHAIESHFNAMGATFSNVMAPLALVGLEAGAILEGIKTAVEFAAEAFHHFMESAEIMAKLHYETGETYQSLNEMGIALKMTGGNVSQLEGFMKGASRAVKANREAIEAHGGATVKAALKTGTFADYLKAVVKRADEYKGGVDRGAYLTEALGRAGATSGHQLKLMVKAMDEAKNVAAAFGITLGKDDVEAMEELHKQTGKMSAAWDMIQVQVARELMPVIKQLATLFADYLPKAMEIFKTIVRILRADVAAFTMNLREMGIVGTAGYANITEYAQAFYEVLKNPTHFVEITKRLAEDVTRIWDTALSLHASNVAAYDAEMKSIVSSSFHGTDEENNKRGDKYGKKKKSKESDEAFRAAEVRLKLEEETTAKLLHEKGQFYEKSYQYEVDFWTKALKEEGLNTKETEEMQKKLTDAKQASYKEDLTAKKASLDYEMDQEKLNLQAKLRLAQEEAKMYDEGTNWRIQAERKVEGVRREIRNQEHAIALAEKEFNVFMAKDEADEHIKELKFRESMGEITAGQEIELERQTIAKKFDLDIQYTRDILLLEAKTEGEKAKLQNKILELQAQKRRAMKDSERARMDEQLARWRTLAQGITGAMGQAFTGLVNGSMSWANAFKTVMKGVLDSFVQMGVKMAEDWAIRKGMMLAKTLLFGAQETASNDSVAANNLSVGVASDKALAISAAGLAAVNAMASVAAIPFYGWAMAGPVGMQTLAMALGLASAEGGWGRVPQDTVAQIHKDEMVLPAKYAQGLRSMFENGDGGGKGGDTHHHHYNITAMDAKSFQRFASEKGNILASTVQRQARNFQGMGQR